MNHLAHLYLSGSQPEILLGNFIADFLTPVQQRALPDELQQGLRLHLLIDKTVDTNMMFKKSVALLRSTQGKYAPVVADIFYDYLLVEEWSQFTICPYIKFKSKIYAQLGFHTSWSLPIVVHSRIDRMLDNDFLRSYESREHIPHTFSFLKKRVKFENQFDHALRDFNTSHETLLIHFNQVFPTIIDAVTSHGVILQN